MAKLTDVLIRKISVPKGKPCFVWEAGTDATGFGIKVTPSGARLFVLQTVYPGHKTPARRTLGKYPSMSLADARAKAIAWYGLVKAGIDPSVEEAKAEAEAKRDALLAKERGFAAVAEAYITRALPKQRWGHRVERQIRKELIPRWADRTITEIGRQDVVALIERIVDRTTTGSYARNILQITATLFSWAIERGCYGIEHSPCDRIKPKNLVGKKTVRERVLSDTEIRSLWSATGEIGYPFGTAVRLLLLTGCRVNEIMRAEWKEADLPNKVWVIPAARFKSESEHMVALSADAVALLGAIPRNGRYVFTTNGRRPVSGLSKAKARIDGLMGADVPHWVFHDLRRVVRSKLSALHVPEPVAEMVLGHGKKGLARIYDRHRFETEIREALEAWARLLRTIVEPSDDKVVALRRA